MEKFIVIEKDKIKKLVLELELSNDDWAKGRRSAFLGILKYSTELSTDESIEERAEKKYPDAIVTINLAKKMRYIEGATEQSLIEQMKAKEFADWINKNEYSKIHGNRWVKPFMSQTYTTEELFNQFTNQKK